MSEFIVSARKYRPSTFEEVVGQEHVTKTLYNEIRTEHLAQSFLFCGPRGVGKTTCARILAREINKDSIEDKTYDYSFNIFELDAASNNSVDDIRLLNEQVRIPPQIGKYKVYIIDEVHMLSAAAFNAFLKTLEEPPPYAIFILATTERHKILPTILSRCQIFNFNRISVERIVAHLQEIADKEKINVEEEALHIIAQKADGALRDALSIFDQMSNIGEVNSITYRGVIENLNVLDYDIYFKITDAFLDGDISQALLVFDDLLSNGFDAHLFLMGLANHFRDIMVSKSPQTLKLLEVPPSLKEKYLHTSKSLDQGFLVNAIQTINLAETSYKASRNPRLHVELALIKICYLPALLSGEKKKPESDSEQPLAPKKKAKKEVISEKKESPKAVEDLSQKTEADIIDQEAPKFAEGQRYKGFKKGNAKIASLSGLNELLEDSNLSEEEGSEEEIEILPENEIDAKAILEAYEDYLKFMENNGTNRLKSLLKILKPKVEGKVLIFELLQSQMIQLEDERSTILQHIRNKVNSSLPEIQFVEVEHKSEGTRAYTDKEKFDAMAEKNPLLKSLRDKLNLEFD
jgi:DNA polymerase-3 subunit gamma/tau